MALEPGTSIGPYVVVALEGSGGMGHVYRGVDPRLKRDVAIKVLPAEFSTDHERLARFQREAEILATLHHSNIASVYGVEEFEGSRALIMEFVDGATLADRLVSGALPAREVVDIARQLAEALDVAHERGIVHRDLKPANIKITGDGTLKVLDFGLAKALDRSGWPGRPDGVPGVFRPDSPDQPDRPDLSASPTLTSPRHMTGVGVILGTAAYMSPEQARGKPVDKRADIWAFGCVLFELLSGRRPFGGETVTDVLAAVVGHEPDWSRLPADTPVALQTIIRRCLRKDPKARTRDIGDVRTALDDTDKGVDVGSQQPPGSFAQIRGRSSRRWTWAVAGIVLGAVAVGVLSFVKQEPRSSARATRFVVLPPDDGAFNTSSLHQAISPDGSRLAFLAYAGSGPGMIWVRALDDVAPHVLPGTEGARTLFWSPDSTSIAFFADGAVKKVGVDGGAVRKIADAPISSRLQLLTSAGQAGSWNSTGTIVFGPLDDGRLWKVDAGGGTPVPVTTLGATTGAAFHLLPEFLPDGQHFLYFSRPGGDIEVGTVGGDPPRHLLKADCKAIYSTEQLLFVRGNTLYRQGFKPDSLQLESEPSVVAEGVRCNPANGGGGYSVSSNGVLTHRAGEIGSQEQLTWYSRSGQVQATVEGPSPGRSLRLSPDLRFLAVDEGRMFGSARNSDIWAIDLLRGSRQRITSDGMRNQMPVWSPTGGQLVFSQQVGEQTRLMRTSTRERVSEEVLVEAECVQRPTDWSTDNRFLVFDRSCPGQSFDVWAVAPDKSAKPIAVLASKFDERQARISPDVRWIAYSSDESGKPQVYVQNFPTPGGAVAVSVDGGTHPQWRRDGKELVFMDLERRLVAVTIDLRTDPPTVGAPQVLFQTSAPRDLFPEGNAFDMSPDGQRFLVGNVLEGLQTPPIVVVLNWMAALQGR